MAAFTLAVGLPAFSAGAAQRLSVLDLLHPAHCQAKSA